MRRVRAGVVLVAVALGGVGLAVAGSLYPEPESFAIEDVSFMRWSGGNLRDPDLTWEFVRPRDFEDPAFERTAAIEVNRRTGQVRYCARYNVHNKTLEPCEGAKRLR